jgi:hypothetical protein
MKYVLPISGVILLALSRLLLAVNRTDGIPRGSIRRYRFNRKLFGAASIAASLMLMLSIASLWGSFEIHQGSWALSLDDGQYSLYQPRGPHDGMTVAAPYGVDCDDAAIAFGYLLLFLMLGYALARRLHQVKLSETGHCHECGYNLTGNASGVCPECGTAVRSKQLLNN